MNKGFFETGDGVFVGKGLDAVRKSKMGRNSLVALFGGIELLPASIMRAKRAKTPEKVDELTTKRGYNNTAPGFEQSKNNRLSKDLKIAYAMSGKGCGAGALSAFHREIGRSVVLFYTNPGDIVFDPFAGHNSRMELCVRTGRHYVGCDLSTEFMAFNNKRAKQLCEEFPEANIVLHHCDSRKVPVKDEVGDFTITSPPYFDIEYYGDEPEQLGKAGSYKDFLIGLGKVMKENYRCLKPGAFACWFVNDFRKNKKFHLYHVDVIRLAKKAGFVPHDLMIVDMGNSIRDCFINQAIETKILPKRHEYCLVFRKPKEGKHARS